MEDFYRTMIEFTEKRKQKNCNHERTFKWCGWCVCTECRTCISRIFSQDIYSYLRGFVANKPKEDRILEIRKIMYKMIRTIVIKDRIDVRDLKEDYKTKEIYDVGPPGGNLPRELFDHLKELCLKCMDLEKDVKCHRRSLCAAFLWDKIKSLYPSSMTLTEFSKRVGVSVP